MNFIIFILIDVPKENCLENSRMSVALIVFVSLPLGNSKSASFSHLLFDSISNKQI